MMSDEEIKDFLYSAIKGLELSADVTGKISKRGRPNGSDKEDVVISILANDGCGEMQTAFANVNVYVSDEWNDSTNSWEEATVRLRELCNLSKPLFDLYGNGWRVDASKSSQRIHSTNVTFEDGHSEHFINNKLYLEICN